ncbi:hypothetical protein MMC14_000354 [Varicellaria rhodocarpa]|nr:hypothetical protein [Varicellaria rhodocarpa]
MRSLLLFFSVLLVGAFAAPLSSPKATVDEAVTTVKDADPNRYWKRDDEASADPNFYWKREKDAKPDPNLYWKREEDEASPDANPYWRRDSETKPDPNLYWKRSATAPV